MTAIGRFLLTLLLLAASAPLFAQTKVAVLPIQPKTGLAEKDTEIITDLVTAEAAKRTDLKVIGTSELKTLVSFEQQREMLACTDDSCLAEVGAALGVDAVVNGNLGRFGGSLVFTLVLMDIKTARVLGRVTETVPDDAALLPLLPYFVATLMANIPGGPPPPPRPTGAPAASPTPGKGAPAGTETRKAHAEKDEGGGSSMGRRLAGLGVAGAGGLLLVGALVAGAASVAYVLAGRFAVPMLTTGYPKYVGTGIAALADLGGILALVVIASGVALAAIP